MLSKLKAVGIALLVASGGRVFGADLPPEMADPAKTGPTPRALRVSLSNVWRPKEPTIAIPTGEEPTATTLTFDTPQVPDGKLVVMRFRMRMVSDGFGGWNNFLVTDVNGTTVEAYTRSGTPRLLNRSGPMIKTSSPKWPSEPYFKSVEGSKLALLTVCGSSWTEIEPRFVTDRQELYWFLVDITDLVKAGDANVLTFTNAALARYFGKTPEELTDAPLLVDRLEVGLADASVRDNLVENLTAGIASFRPVATVSNADVSLSASRGGVLCVDRQGDRTFCRSTFSEPGDTVGLNRFWWDTTPEWHVSVSRAGPDRLVVVGTAGPYRVRREAVLDGRFVRVRDTVINTGSADVGIMLNHELVSEKSGRTWRLSGLENVPAYGDTAANPTAHLSRDTTGVGVAVIDSIMRGQMLLSGGRRVLTLSNDHFGLAKGKSHTFEWSVYSGGPDFWEFINAVRRDWNANATIPGMYSFWRPETGPHKELMDDPEKLRAYLRRKRIDIFSLSPWFEYYSPVAYWQPRSAFKKIVQDAMAKIRAVQPDAKFVANTETFLYYAPPSLFKGTLPRYWLDAKGDLGRGSKRPHDLSLSAAATRVIDATQWRDSVFRDAAGNVVIDLHYAGAYKDGGVNLKVFPMLDNYWFGKFNEMVDYLIDECGFDGIYIDSFTYYQSRTSDRWDGYSVDIDPATGRITSKYARLGILTAPARRAWVKHITDRGKICYVNGKRSTAELQDLAQVGFMEAEWTFNPANERLAAPRAAKAQLSAPLALGVRPHRWPEHKTQYAQIVQKAVIAYLRHGALYCHYTTEIPKPGSPGGGECGILNHMFPFTPTELHEGWVVGQERIITTVSRTFSWPHRERPVCLRFDLRGMALTGGFTLERADEGWQVAVALDDWRETAVVKQP